jgi:hypothetical protein
LSEDQLDQQENFQRGPRQSRLADLALLGVYLLAILALAALVIWWTRR